MTDKQLRFAIFGNVYQAKKSASIQKILACLSQRDAKVMIEKEFYNFITKEQLIDVGDAEVFEDSDFSADFVISMGGDGTFLKSAGHVGPKNIPIVGVNMGRLGFLADISPSDIESAITAIYDGDYDIESRGVLQIETSDGKFPECPFALNDISVLKRDNASMISIKATINGEYLTTYQADGLVVTTPTGSTAYSLSNGGPILLPSCGVFGITPVAPHSMNIRPIVVPDDSVIELSVASRSHNFLIAVDGRSVKCEEGIGITMRKAGYEIQVVKQKGNSYFHTMRDKLMWGADVR